MLGNQSLDFEVPLIVRLLIDKHEVGQVNQDFGLDQCVVIGCSIEVEAVT